MLSPWASDDTSVGGKAHRLTTPFPTKLFRAAVIRGNGGLLYAYRKSQSYAHRQLQIGGILNA